jgi:hypothetical protein
MNLSKHKQTLSNVPRVTFAQLARNTAVPATTLRSRLEKLGIEIPTNGFSVNLASKIDHLIHAEGCLQGWLIVEQFSSNPDQVNEARKQAGTFRERYKFLLKQITRK